MISAKFEQRFPSVQNAVDIFAGKWATYLGDLLPVKDTGHTGLLSDSRVQMAAAALGHNNRFSGMCILELGPLEGAHSYQLEQLGASQVRAIESNTEAFLKCLVLKEALKMRTEFLCGDVVSYLGQTNYFYDVVFCSGILYHMANPLELIKLICGRARSCFVWTHYQSASAIAAGTRLPKIVETDGCEVTFYEAAYADMAYGQFWGGNKPIACWLSQEDIVRAFAHFGFGQSLILEDQPDHPNGGAFSAVFAAEDYQLAV